ncbi:MAG: ATP-binding cassette domain-containing protein [Bacteroidota bacterium]|nr:ATP-binding cassette domain-containing protein [Bacteroidota bacterium]
MVETYGQNPVDNIIEVDELVSIIDEKVILSDVSFQVRTGEITAILGSSGSGKTTVLKHLLGIYSSIGNAVTVLGKNPSELKESEEKGFYRQMGVMYQEGALLNSMTVGENVGLPLDQHLELPGELIEHIVKIKLQLVNLEDAFDKFPSQLSGGMLKRAALARAIVMDPLVLFCDEPGAGLDPVTMSKLDSLIVELKKQLGMTVVMVTHEVPSTLRMADQIVFLENGVSIFHGTPESALESSPPVVKDFFARGMGKIIQ